MLTFKYERSYPGCEEVDQLVDPFEVLFFLRATGQLRPGYLRALTQWCLRGVHRPNVRSERRPTTAQLVSLYDFCREEGLEEEPALNDAIAYFVESAGGKWHSLYARPLAYTKKRFYIRRDDPLEGLALPPLPGSKPISKAVAKPEDLPGLPSLPGLPEPERQEVEAEREAAEAAPAVAVRKKPSGSSSS